MPPWANADPADAGWGSFQPQGPEVFESGSGGGKGRTLAVVAVLLLAVAVGAGTVYLTVFRPDDSTTAQPQPSASTTTAAPPTSAPPQLFGPLFVPEGRTSGPKMFKAEELFAAKPLPAPDLVVLKQAGLSGARSVVVVNKTTTMSMWAFTPGANPATLHEQLTTDQARFGYTEVTGATQGGVHVFSSKQDSPSRTIHVYRTHYVSGTDVIRVEAFDVTDTVARAAFDDVLARQLAHTPAK